MYKGQSYSDAPTQNEMNIFTLIITLMFLFSFIICEIFHKGNEK
jgi:hypothetical protein